MSHPTHLTRPALSANLVLCLVAVYLIVFANARFWSIVVASSTLPNAHGVGVVLTVAVALFAITLLMLLPLSFKGALKPTLIAVLLFAAVAAYFIGHYGAVVDRHALASLYETDAREAGEWLSWRMFTTIGLLGLLPAALVCWVKIVWRAPLPEFLGRLKLAAIALALLGVSALAFGKDVASLLRNHMELRHIANPFSVLSAHLSYLDHLGDADKPLRHIGKDARRIAAFPASSRPLVVVLVVGESMRAQSLDLDGYARDTDVDLHGMPIVNFSHVSSCGTNTATSVPCMFSGVGRADYEDGMAKRQENLLDVLRRGGYDVIWLDNNTGSKGLAKREREVSLANAKDPKRCNAEGCHDEILTDALARELPKIRRDTVIVLHMLGSHGPAYYARYPAPFARFQPECKTNQLQDCSDEQLRNTYDNSVLYSTHVLSLVVRSLGEAAAAKQRFDAAMLFVSDHGESLGEKGLYLHGAPYMIAPEEQTHVPMLFWASRGFYQRRGLNIDCIRAHSDAKLSHDHFFHSVLGLAGVASEAHQLKLDVFAPCEPQ
jgi:lipid A ethanolaminephosphotransferase